MPHRIGLILLAAGGSSRMGRPKQLLQYRGQSLLKRAAKTATQSSASLIVVVLGAHFEQCRAELDGLNLTIVENKDWPGGMGTSIRAGVDSLEAEVDGVVLMLCDQPEISSADIDRLIEEHRRSGKELVGAEYPGNVGVPAFFARSIFPQLKNLPDNAGCKQILNADPAKTAAVKIPGARFDIDTPEDYHKAHD